MQRQNPAAVLDRTVPVVRAVEEVEAGRWFASSAHGRERSAPSGMVRAARTAGDHRASVCCAAPSNGIDREGAGRPCRSRAGIDEQRHASARERDRQRIRVGVPAVLVSMSPAVDHQMIACRAARHVVPGLAQRSRSGRTPAAVKAQPPVGGRGASAGCASIQTASSGVAPGCELAVARQRACHRQTAPDVVQRATGERHQRAAVVVSNVRQAAFVVGHAVAQRAQALSPRVRSRQRPGRP